MIRRFEAVARAQKIQPYSYLFYCSQEINKKKVLLCNRWKFQSLYRHVKLIDKLTDIMKFSILLINFDVNVTNYLGVLTHPFNYVILNHIN